MRVAVAAFLALAVTPLPATALEAPATHPGDRRLVGLAQPAEALPWPPARYAEATTTWLELLGEAVPGVRRVSILLMLEESHDPDVAAWAEVAAAAGQAARRRAMRSEIMTVRHRGGLLDAFVMMRQSGVDGVVVLPTRLALDRAADVAALAARHRLPLIGGDRRFADSGALLSYGLVSGAEARPPTARPGGLAEDAADTAVGQPTRFELVINGKTARALGLTIHPPLRLRADRIIE